jgi:type II secretion system (T2SS) protein E
MFSADMSGRLTYGYGQTIYAIILCRWDLPTAGLLRLTYLESPPYQHFQGFTPDADNQVKEVSYSLTEGDVTGIESIVGWPYKYRWTLELTAAPWPDTVEQDLRDDLTRRRERYTGSPFPASLEQRYQVPRVFYGHRQEVDNHTFSEQIAGAIQQYYNSSTDKDLGDLLSMGRVLTPEQLAAAREMQRQTGEALEQILEQQFQVKPFQILQARAHLANMRAIDLATTPPTPSAVGLVPADLARRHQIIPIQKINQKGEDVLVCAVADPSNVMAMDEVSRACHLKVLAVLASPEQVAEAIARCYPSGDC